MKAVDQDPFAGFRLVILVPLDLRKMKIGLDRRGIFLGAFDPWNLVPSPPSAISESLVGIACLEPFKLEIHPNQIQNFIPS